MSRPPFRATLTAALLCSAAVLSPSASTQDLQEGRHDLGQRLRRLERAFADTAPDPARPDGPRTAVAAAMQRAVGSFFALDLRRAAAALDDGYAVLRGIPAADRPVLALGAVPSTRLQALGTPVQLTIAPRYDDDAWPDDLEVRLRVAAGTVAAGTVAAGTVAAGTGAADGAAGPAPFRGPHQLALPSPADEGDVLAVVEGRRAGSPDGVRGLEIARVGVAFVRDPAPRLRALAAAADAAAGPALEAATLDHLARLLEDLHRGRAVETDLPAARLLAEAEAVAAAVAGGERFYGDARPGEFWLRVPVGRRGLPVRLLVPARADGDTATRPLVLALHGAGGSENLFFDGYGDGLVARLAAERGFYVCAPRAMPAGSAAALLDALAARFAIDPDRVYCVGHSMGAMTAVDAAQRAPGRFARVAALGGGGRVADGEALAAVPFLVGVGDRDFALAGARGLARALERDGCPVELKVYPGIEHMLVVQVALPDVFAFFDR